MTAVAVIPARYDSTRLPGKALLDICGKPMIQHVHERVVRAASLTGVCVATDDRRIADVVRGYGGRVIMTRPDHPTGTDRIAEAAEHIEADIVVNVQGDEPLIEPAMVDLLVDPMREDPDLCMTTLKSPIVEAEELTDPSTVKVVTDLQGYALYFSRSTIPFNRAASDEDRQPVYKHLGLYAYRKDFLLEYARLPRTPLQRAEELEQLRVLEHGVRIKVMLTEHESIGVDTERDLERARVLMARLLASGAGSGASPCE